jgi:KaiC/GvpD/RAD55 family RecA-like ATPase
MITSIPSGISNLDSLISGDDNGGIPENTVTLVYGPPKVGKSIFCYQFMLKGLQQNEGCLFISADYGIEQLNQNTSDFGLELEKYFLNEKLYIIDTLSSVSGIQREDTPTYISSSVHTPTDIMVKLGTGARFIKKRSPQFRSILDSLTTLLAFNDEMLIVRVLTAYVMRLKESGGTGIVTYTEGTADSKVETMLKSVVDNIIRLDGEKITIEAMVGIGKKTSDYIINENGIILDSSNPD